MKHSCLINGYDSLNLTKLDVLDEVEEIKVAVKYMIDDKELQYFPGELTMDLNELYLRFPQPILTFWLKSQLFM
jgi:adenylosuccinate synthase